MSKKRRASRSGSGAKKSQKRKRLEPVPRRLPSLDVSIPDSHPGEGYTVAETFIPKNHSAILDIVLPKPVRVEAWCCFGRPSRKMDWTVVANHPDENGRHVIPVPRTDFYVWGFGRVASDSGKGELVWRVHGHNIGIAGKGRDVCLRLVVRTARSDPARVAIAKKSTRREVKSSSKPRASRPKPVAARVTGPTPMAGSV